MKTIKMFFANLGFILSIVGAVVLIVWYKTRKIPVNPNSVIEKRKEQYHKKYDAIDKEYKKQKEEHKAKEEKLKKSEEEIKDNIKDREEKEKKFWR